MTGGGDVKRCGASLSLRLEGYTGLPARTSKDTVREGQLCSLASCNLNLSGDAAVTAGWDTWARRNRGNGGRHEYAKAKWPAGEAAR